MSPITLRVKNNRGTVVEKTVSMRWMIRAWTVAFCLWVLLSQAAVLDPWAFTSLGTLDASKTMSINSLSGRSGLIVTTGTGIRGRIVNLGSGAITLTSGAVSG
jgi:hypothetical protein